MKQFGTNRFSRVEVGQPRWSGSATFFPKKEKWKIAAETGLSRTLFPEKNVFNNLVFFPKSIYLGIETNLKLKITRTVAR